MALKRRHKNSNRQNEGKRVPAHLQWVRGHICCIAGKNGHVCDGVSEAMHVDYAGGKGMGVKVSDRWAIPGCSRAHREQHQIGWPAFEKKYGINAQGMAEGLFRRSPHRSKFGDAA